MRLRLRLNGQSAPFMVHTFDHGQTDRSTLIHVVAAKLGVGPFFREEAVRMYLHDGSEVSYGDLDQDKVVYFSFPGDCWRDPLRNVPSTTTSTVSGPRPFASQPAYNPPAPSSHSAGGGSMVAPGGPPGLSTEQGSYCDSSALFLHPSSQAQIRVMPSVSALSHLSRMKHVQLRRAISFTCAWKHVRRLRAAPGTPKSAFKPLRRSWSCL